MSSTTMKQQTKKSERASMSKHTTHGQANNEEFLAQLRPSTLDALRILCKTISIAFLGILCGANLPPVVGVPLSVLLTSTAMTFSYILGQDMKNEIYFSNKFLNLVVGMITLTPLLRPWNALTKVKRSDSATTAVENQSSKSHVEHKIVNRMWFERLCTKFFGSSTSHLIVYAFLMLFVPMLLYFTGWWGLFKYWALPLIVMHINVGTWTVTKSGRQSMEILFPGMSTLVAANADANADADADAGADAGADADAGHGLDLDDNHQFHHDPSQGQAKSIVAAGNTGNIAKSSDSLSCSPTLPHCFPIYRLENITSHLLSMPRYSSKYPITSQDSKSSSLGGDKTSQHAEADEHSKDLSKRTGASTSASTSANVSTNTNASTRKIFATNTNRSNRPGPVPVPVPVPVQVQVQAQPQLEPVKENIFVQPVRYFCRELLLWRKRDVALHAVVLLSTALILHPSASNLSPYVSAFAAASIFPFLLVRTKAARDIEQIRKNNTPQNVALPIEQPDMNALTAEQLKTMPNYVAIDNGVFDLEAFAPKHPGGDVIRSMGGIDATALFYSLHAETAEKNLKVLNKYRVGTLAPGEENFVFTFHSSFAEDLKSSVKEYLDSHPRSHAHSRSHSRSRYAPIGFWARTAFIAVGTLLSELVWMTTGSLAAMVVVGCFHAWIGLAVQHDASHGALSANHIVNDIFAYGADWIGNTRWLWLQQHIIGHHPHTNIEGADPDAHSAEPFLLFHMFSPESATRKWLHKYQALYMYPVLALYGPSVVYNLPELFSLNHGEIPHNPWVLSKRPAAIAFRFFYYARIVLLPYLLGNAPLLFAVLGVPFVTGFLLTFVFVLSHNFDGSDRYPYEFPELKKDEKDGDATADATTTGGGGGGDGGVISEEKDPREANTGKPVVDWYKMQVETSCSYGGTLAMFFTGGLNHQIIHHVFPRMSSWLYTEVEPIVAQVCKRHGVQFHYFPNIWENMKSTFAFMYANGQENDTRIPAGIAAKDDQGANLDLNRSSEANGTQENSTDEPVQAEKYVDARYQPASQSYSAEAVNAAMDSKEPLPLVVDGVAYDVRKWLPHHPGGDIILHYVGRDATDVFHAMHAPKTTKTLARLPKLGKVSPIPPSVATPPSAASAATAAAAAADDDDDRDTITKGDAASATTDLGDTLGKPFRGLGKRPQAGKTLQRTPEQEAMLEDFRTMRRDFEAEGLFKASLPWIVYKSVTTVAIGVVAHIWLGMDSSWVGAVGSGVVMGLCLQQLGWLAHDYCHHAVLEDRTLNTMFGYVFGNLGQGFSVLWWRTRHNEHHAITNVHEHDPDIDNLPVFAWSKHDVEDALRTWSPGAVTLLKYQHWYFLPFITLLRVVWCLQSMLTAIGLVGNTNSYYRRAYRKELALLIGHWVWRFVALSLLASSWKKGLLHFVIAEAVGGFCIALVVFCNHYPIDKVDDEVASCWPQMQALGTVNVAPGVVTSWFFGGLDYQIEHHLFMTMPRHNFSRIQARVEAFCNKHKIPYRAPSFPRAVADVLVWLKDIAATIPDDCVVACEQMQMQMQNQNQSATGVKEKTL